MKKSQNIHIGHCTTPHGIKGDFSFVLYNLEDSILSDGSIITLYPRSEESSLPQDGKDFQILKISIGNKAIVKIKGIEDRTTVEKMVPFDIYFDRENFPEIEEGEYYINDLLGLLVFDFKTKENIGRVIDFYENGVQVVLKIKTKNEIIDLIFMEQFVPVVDIEGGKIEVNIPIIIE